MASESVAHAHTLACSADTAYEKGDFARASALYAQAAATFDRVANDEARELDQYARDALQLLADSHRRKSERLSRSSDVSGSSRGSEQQEEGEGRETRGRGRAWSHTSKSQGVGGRSEGMKVSYASLGDSLMPVEVLPMLKGYSSLSAPWVRFVQRCNRLMSDLQGSVTSMAMHHGGLTGEERRDMMGSVFLVASPSASSPLHLEKEEEEALPTFFAPGEQRGREGEGEEPADSSRSRMMEARVVKFVASFQAEVKSFLHEMDVWSSSRAAGGHAREFTSARSSGQGKSAGREDLAELQNEVARLRDLTRRQREAIREWERRWEEQGKQREKRR